MTSIAGQLETPSISHQAAQTPASPAGIGELFAVSREALLSNPAQFEALTDGLSAWIWETDSDQRFVYLSPSVVRMTGLTPAMHYGHRLSELAKVSIKTIDGMTWEDHLRSAKGFGPMDFFCVHEQRAFVIRTLAYPRHDETGRYVGHCGIALRLPSEKQQNTKERRTNARRRLVRAAEIVCNDCSDPIPSILLDLSTSGARLQVLSTTALSPTFRLVVASLSLDSECRLRWRNASEAGVEFLEP